MKRLLLATGLLWLWCGTVLLQAEEPDDQFIQIYNLIQQADALAENGHSDLARSKYADAQTLLKSFRTKYPDWNESLVKFRLTDLAEKLDSASTEGKDASPGLPEKTLASHAGPDKSEDSKLLKEKIRQLATDKELLQAKLSEALAAQPTAVDPRELIKAQETIKSLRKEVEILEINLNKSEARPDKPVDPKVLADAQRAAVAANEKLEQQSDQIATMVLEKEALQKRLQAFVEGKEIKTLRKDNESLKQQVDELQAKAAAGAKAEEVVRQVTMLQTDLAGLRARNEVLTGEKVALENRLKELKLSNDAESMARTRSLEEKLAYARAFARTNAMTLTALRNSLKLTQEDKERLEKENRDMQIRMTAAQGALAVARATFESNTRSDSDAEQINRLKQEREEQQQKLNVVSRKLYDARSSAQVAQTQAGRLTNEIVALEARLRVLEADKVPYSPEELALFKTPPPALIGDVSTGIEDKTASESTLGTNRLIVEAERAFRDRHYDDAEKKYTQVLRRDAKNVHVLAHLAAVQIERNKLTEAEANLKRALGSNAKDAFSLSLLGILKTHQRKYEEAIDFLSQATRLDSQNSVAFQHLGIALAAKGLRGPAESAFRRAIQLAPRDGNAHYNLAVFYATRQPASLELARWHYQKALVAGHPKDEKLEKMLK